MIALLAEELFFPIGKLVVLDFVSQFEICIINLFSSLFQEIACEGKCTYMTTSGVMMLLPVLLVLESIVTHAFTYDSMIINVLLFPYKYI